MVLYTRHRSLHPSFFVFAVVGLLFCVFFCLSPSLANAQQGGLDQLLNDLSRSGPAPDRALEVTPQYPGAREETTVALPSTITQVGGGVRWFIDGARQTAFDDEREMAFTTGSIGQSTTITAHILENGAVAQRLEQIITPQELDIIVEGNTVTPYFYKGRALPSRSASVLVTAIPHRDDGRSYEEYTYRWTVDGEVLEGGAVPGKHQVEFDAPSKSDFLVRVEVTDPAGAQIAMKLVRVTLADPEIRFYTVNPLRGTKQVALSNGTAISESEITLRAEPYYYDPDLLFGESQIAWEVNGREVGNHSDDPQEIVLRNPDRENARALVTFSLGSRVELLQFANENIDIRFRGNE